MPPVISNLSGRLLVALLLLAASLVLAPAPAAYACSCASRTLAQQLSDADAVFTGTVAGPAERTSQQRLVYRVRVERVYAGSVEPEVELRTAAQGTACGLTDLPVGERVLFLANGSGATVTSNSCSGTTLAAGRLVERVEERLGAGADPGPAAPTRPEPATFTPVADGDPASFRRVAAPGLAMVIAGLLGLVLVRRLGGR